MPTPLRLAVLIDADNVGVAAMKRALPDIEKLGRITVCSIYGRLTKAMRPGWVAALESGGCPTPSIVYRRGSNAADFALTIDAVHLMHKGEVDCFCLVSSDRDFVHVVRYLRAGNAKVHVFGPDTAARSLQRAADRFHAIRKPAAAHPLQSQPQPLQ